MKITIYNIETNFNIPSFKNTKSIWKNKKTGKPFIATDKVKAKKMNQIIKQLSLSSGLAITGDETLTVWFQQCLILLSAPKKLTMIQLKKLGVYLRDTLKSKKVKKVAG